MSLLPSGTYQGVSAVGGVADVTYAIGTETANVIRVSCQFLDGNGRDTNYPVGVVQYLATAADAQTVKVAATSLVAGTDGTLTVEIVSNSVWLAISENDGDLDIDIGDASGAATYFLVTVLPNGRAVSSGVITFV